MPRGTVLWVSSIPCTEGEVSNALWGEHEYRPGTRIEEIQRPSQGLKGFSLSTRGIFVTTLAPCMGGPKERLNSGFCWNIWTCDLYILFMTICGWMEEPAIPTYGLYCHVWGSHVSCRPFKAPWKTFRRQGKENLFATETFSQKTGSIFFPGRYSFDWPICLVSPTNLHHSRKDLTIWLVNLQLILSWFLLGATSWSVLQAVKGLLLMSFLESQRGSGEGGWT